MFVTNKATTAGGAVYGLNLGRVVVDNVNFTRNFGNRYLKMYVLIFKAGRGAGMYLENPRDVTFSRSTFYRQNATNGGGAYITSPLNMCSFTVDNCVFSLNYAG
jgi:hypothetical protein